MWPAGRRFHTPELEGKVGSSNDLMVRASASTAVDLGLILKWGQTNDLKIGIFQLPYLMLTMKGQCGEQAGKFTCCAVGKGTQRDSPILVW